LLLLLAVVFSLGVAVVDWLYVPVELTAGEVAVVVVVVP